MLGLSLSLMVKVALSPSQPKTTELNHNSFHVFKGALITPIMAKPFLREAESTAVNGTLFDSELELEETEFWTIKSLYPLIFLIMVLPVPFYIYYFIQVVFKFKRMA